MSARRLGAVYSLELASTLKRPLFWSLVILLLLSSWGLSTGSMTISSGDSSVGGTKAWTTSEFSFAQVLAYLVALIYGFFAAIAAGTAVTNDDESKVGEILHSTPLQPAEYVWGKFLAVTTAFLGALGLHLLFAAFFNHVVPNAKAAEIRGPFELVSYLRPTLVFAVPMLLFLLGVSWFLGERWRRPVTVFLFPVGVLLVCGFFLWSWAPTWLDPRLNRALMLIDPTGFRWLSETWLKLDRGARFYNTARIGLDAPFVLSRLAFACLGLLAVAITQRHVARTVRGIDPRARTARRTDWLSDVISSLPAAAVFKNEGRLAALGMRQAPVGFLRSSLMMAGTEVRNLLASPALYLFSLLILLQVMGRNLLLLGAFQTFRLLTPGQLAVGSMDTLSFLGCSLLMFYTVESLERDHRTGFAALAYSAPVPTGAILFGKALANSVVGLFLVACTFVGCAIALLVQHVQHTGQALSFDLRPFLLVWGLLLVPTYLVWTAFVTAVRAVTGQRYASYGVCLGVLALTGYFLFTGKMSWLGNWPLWSALRWSDLSVFETDRRALVLNRLFVLSLTALFTAVAAGAFQRRFPDAIGTLNRLSPRQLSRQAFRLAPFLAVPLVLGILLATTVRNGIEGSVAQKKAHDYWKQNLATWVEAPEPAIAAVDLDLSFAPERHWLRDRGSYDLVNDRDHPLTRFALTGGPHWRKVRWTLDGKPWTPESRSGLYVFTPPAPLPPGGRVRVGFEFEGVFPQGVTKNGGNTSEFILPSGVVLTSFTPSFAPLLGFQEGVGTEKGKNDYEPKDYPPDFWVGRTDAAFGTNSSFPTRIRITGPAEYTWNSVGVKTSEIVSGGQRTAVWQSDRPVRFFNVIGGRWQERRGAEGTAIHYDARHAWNIAEMSAALDAARHWYSEWFHPYPWRELKLSEFPGLAGYAQGFPTNITFSENIGFLTESDVKTDAVFLVTAHESAHQWWGNLVTPGKGPGGDILSEGMSHFSMLLLMEKVKGERARMETAKRLEEQYGDARRADAERPLVRVDGAHDGDQTVTYDKGGWVFWMLQRQMGRERALAGLRQFVTTWSDNPDHPVLQDFIAAMRPFAPDAAAYDAFVHQWFLEVVVPEYRLSGGRKSRTASGWEAVVKVRNAGTGRMPVDVAATRGERFTADGKPGAGWRDARGTVLLGPGEEREVRIACPFEPESLVVDPDVQVLQLRRKAAVQSLR